MSNERLQRISDHPGRASMEDVAWLASLVVSLEDRLKQRANAIAKLHVELDQMQAVIDDWAEMNRKQLEKIDDLTDEVRRLKMKAASRGGGRTPR